jgi:serine/threonine-protein kinase
VQLYRDVAPQDRHLGYALGDLGGIYFRRNDFVRAQEYQKQAIGIAEQQPIPDAAHLTSLYSNQGKLLVAVGDLRGAQAAFARARELVDRAYGPNGRFYWTAISQQARTLHLMGEREPANALFRELMRDIPADSKPFHNAEEEVSAARAREAYGTCLLSEGRARMAVPVLTEAAREFAEAKQDPLSALRVRAVLGEADARAGRIQQAGRLLAEVIAAAGQFQAENPTLLKARLVWGRYLLERGKLTASEREFQQVLHAAREPNSYFVALATGGLAQIATVRHDPSVAVELASQAVDIFDHVVGYRDVRMGPILWQIRADAALLAADAQGALDWAQRALDADRRYDDPESPDIVAAEATRRRAYARVVARSL